MTARSHQSDGGVGFVGAGALAGALSALAFTAIHQLLINPIWFALPAMLGAGALCGVCLAWSYTLAVPRPGIGSWLRYNALYLLMFVALGVTSLVAFQPVTTIAALLKTNEPPVQLIERALPVTGLFTLGSAALVSALYRPGWRGAGGILLATVVLVLLLGLNISILGLVSVPRGDSGVLAEVLVLLGVLAGVYAALVVALRRSRFRTPDSADSSGS